MDLVERMNGSLEEVPVKAEDLKTDPARVALPVLLDLLPRLPEDSGMLTFSGSMILIRAALRLLKRLPTDDARADVVRTVLEETQSRSGRLILIMITDHRKDIGAGLVAVEVAEDLRDSLHEELTGLSPGAFAAETRTVRLADFLAETEEGRTALHDLAEDNRVMLSFFAGSVGEIRGRSMGAAAVEVTKTLAWDRLAIYFGEEMLIRRTAELMQAVTDEELDISDEERTALSLAADYATGNRPETSCERMMRMASSGPPAGAPTVDCEQGPEPPRSDATPTVHVTENEPA
jgi:hypothetical protein